MVKNDEQLLLDAHVQILQGLQSEENCLSAMGLDGHSYQAWKSKNAIVLDVLSEHFLLNIRTQEKHTALQERLEDLDAEYKTYTKSITNSTSWKLTRPLRQVKSFLPRVYARVKREYSNILSSPYSGYNSWISKHESLSAADKTTFDQTIARLAKRPLISIIMPVYNADKAHLNAAIQSVSAQIYSNWELCIANDASTKSYIKPLLDQWCKKDSRIKCIHRAENGHISDASNTALTLANGEWTALLDHDDMLSMSALAEMALAINNDPDADIIYSDEDKIDEKGRRYSPHFKCDFSPELFHSMNYFNHLTLLRTHKIKQVGGWRSKFNGSQDYDLFLRVLQTSDKSRVIHIPKILYHWRATKGSTALSIGEKNYALIAGKNALKDHIKQMKFDADVSINPDTPYYRVKFNIKDPAPLVSLIIPTRDCVEILKRAIDSIVEKTTYKNYEIIIVDNQSVEKTTHDYFEKISSKPFIKILKYPHEFNYAAMNNVAAAHAKGSIIGLVNNDVEVINDTWLTEMVSWAQLPHVGCVGAKLYYPNNTIQHAGVILGIGGVAGHSHKHFTRQSDGYFARLKVVQNLSAVTAACMLIKKETYQQLGGMDETNLKVAFNDVDICLKSREAGYSNVFTPYAELYHHESKSRGKEDSPEKIRRFNSEIDTMKKRWGKSLKQDPFYSPNLTQETEDFSIKQ